MSLRAWLAFFALWFMVGMTCSCGSPTENYTCMQLCKKASPLFEMDATEIQKDFAGPFYCACRVNVEELMRKSMMGEVK